MRDVFSHGETSASRVRTGATDVRAGRDTKTNVGLNGSTHAVTVIERRSRSAELVRIAVAGAPAAEAAEFAVAAS